MRKITIVCVGTIKEKYFSDAINEYKKRLSRFCEFAILELGESRLFKENQSEISAVIQDEGDRILEKLKGKRVISLAVEGETISSEQFADLVAQESDLGELYLVVGGSYGLDNRVKNLGKKISFGRMTLPHQLMRVVLTEQIYRAMTILNNVTYHK